ncbi:hypothetical protein [Nocardia sp. NPDC050412]|uniref:hypothetical protein n=1 Tax=Nocardia sp. NPDC050412 TaxID=3364320 RepID=UPI00379113D5
MLLVFLAVGSTLVRGFVLGELARPSAVPALSAVICDESVKLAMGLPSFSRRWRVGAICCRFRAALRSGVPWICEQHERIAYHCGVKPSSRARPDDGDAIRLAGLSGLRVARRQVRWSRVVSLDLHLSNITSRSAFLVLAEEDKRAFLFEERRRLREMFPGEAVEETYVVDLLMTTRP